MPIRANFKDQLKQEVGEISTILNKAVPTEESKQLIGGAGGDGGSMFNSNFKMNNNQAGLP